MIMDQFLIFVKSAKRVKKNVKIVDYVKRLSRLKIRI